MKIQKNIQILRLVIDALEKCNLRCLYCHPGGQQNSLNLPNDKIEEIFKVAENNSVLEITLTGGEVTLHPNFKQIMESTWKLSNTVCSIVTNATTVNEDIISIIKSSNLKRVCVSLDGPDTQSNNYARGNTYKKIIDGLIRLQKTNKEITIITVAHKGNINKVIELSKLLAANGWAKEHHICAPSYSGMARINYDRIKLHENDIESLQNEIDGNYYDLLKKGLHVTFNSYWPALGKRSLIGLKREMTLIQLIEQVKNLCLIVRPSGDVRLTSASWGRETVYDSVVGNLNKFPFSDLFRQADNIYRDGLAKQLPRGEEAKYKFLLDETNRATTEKIISHQDININLIPVVPLSKLDIFNVPISDEEGQLITKKLNGTTKDIRVVSTPDDVVVIFDRESMRVTLLRMSEYKVLVK